MINHFTQVGIDFQTDHGLLSVLFRLLKGIVGWFQIIGFMGLGERIGSVRTQEGCANQQVQEAPATDRRPTFVERAAQYLSEAALPIYTLHLIFVIVIGFYMDQWTSNISIRFLVTTILSILCTLATYDIVRCTRVTHFIFGMRARGAEISPPGAGGRGVGGWVRANLTNLGLCGTAALLTALVVIVAKDFSLVGRWEQTLNTIQPAIVYVAESRGDGTWTVIAGDESIEGSYELIGDEQIEFTYPDGASAVAEYRISYDRVGLVSSDNDRQQVFIRIP